MKKKPAGEVVILILNKTNTNETKWSGCGMIKEGDENAE